MTDSSTAEKAREQIARLEGGGLWPDDKAIYMTTCGNVREIIGLLAALTASPAQGDSFAWLIEAPGQNYLWVRNIGGYPDFNWTNDANKALRFWSKEQADKTAMAVRRMAPELWAFAATLGEAWPREHKWISK